MIWRRVSSRALRSRRIEIEGRVYRRVAVLPFFDGEGEVSFCMVVLPHESRLYFFTPHETRPHASLLGTIQLKQPRWSWSDGDFVPSLHSLWHYDPDWLLRDQRFAELPVTTPLRATNCCAKIPEDVKTLHFSRDLTRVLSATRGTNESERTVSITEILSQLATPESPEEAVPQGWRLDPIWMSAMY